MLNRKARILLIIFFVLGILINIVGMGIASSSSIVRYASDWPLSIDPATGMDVQSVVAYINLFDPLVFLDTEGNAIPHIAKSWDVSSDGSTYTFFLQPGIKFHNGEEILAEDVKFSMDRLLTIGEGCSYIWLEKIKETKVIDKYTVQFDLKETFGPFIKSLYSFYIVNKDLIMANIEKSGMYGDMGDYGKKYVSSNDVGSGPFMIKQYNRAEYLLMEKHPNYFLDISSAPDEFKMIGSTQPVLLKTLMSRRELEMTNRWCSGETLDSLAKIEGVEIASWPGGTVEFIAMNTKKAPLDDVHVRKALAWAFDYDAVVELSSGSVQARGPLASALPGNDPDCFQYYRDLEKAKAELKKSKYYGHFDEYPIECQWFTNPLMQKQAMLIMSNAAEIGLTVNVVETTWALFSAASASIETTPHLHPSLHTPYYAEAGSVLQSRYHSMTTGTSAQSEWLLDPVLDEMIEGALASFDTNERYSKYKEIVTYIIDLCPTIFMIEVPERVAYQADYMKYPAAEGNPISAYQYENCMRFVKVNPEEREKLLKK